MLRISASIAFLAVSVLTVSNLDTALLLDDDATDDDGDLSLDIPCIPDKTPCPLCKTCDREKRRCVDTGEAGWGCRCQNDTECSEATNTHLQCGPLSKRCHCEIGYTYNLTECVETGCHGEWGCPCSIEGGDALCTSVDPNSRCDNRTIGTCQCINGYHYSHNLSRCISDTGPCDEDPPCHICFHCNLQTETCQPDWGCHCEDTSECSSSDPHMECDLLHKCECEVGYQYDEFKKTCVDSCSALSTGALAGIIGGVLLENVILVLLTLLIYRRRHAHTSTGDTF